MIPTAPAARSPGPAAARAFTLVEMLVVMAIIGILIALVVPAAKKILGGNQLTDATDRVVGQLRYGQQTAMSKNLPVEVRFYEYNDATVPQQYNEGGDPAKPPIRAIQLWQQNPDGTRTAVGKVQVFPGTNVITVDTARTLTSLPPLVQGNDSSISSLPASERPVTLPANSKYKTFQFRPNGSTTLPLVDPSSNAVPPPPLQWYCTVKNALDPANRLVDFATIQIEPVTGEIRVFRR